MIAANTPMTPEQLDALPDHKGLEIVCGKVVEKRMGYESSVIVGQLTMILGFYLRQNRAGRVTVCEAGFKCFPDDETKFRKPDLAFVSYLKLPASQRIGAYCKVAPDLAVEVLSPNDEAQEIGERVQDYLGAGSQLVWVVDEFLRQVIVYSPAARPQVYGLNDELNAEPVLPGFRCQVSEIFDGIPPAKKSTSSETP